MRHSKIALRRLRSKPFAVVAMLFLVAGCANNPATPKCGRARAAYVAAFTPPMKALTTSPREWRRVCKEAYKKYDGAWLILFPLGAVVPIECGLAHTLASTIILPLLMLPFGIVGGVLSVPFAMVSPDGWCDFPGKIGVGPVPEDPSRGQHCFGLEIEPRNGRESEPTPPDAGQEVRISRVVEGSPAARAGLEVEDRIVSIDGVGLESPGQLQLALGLLKPGDRVALRVLRNGALLDLEVQLEPEDWGRTEDCR